jgi:hypothetical protein
MMGVPWLFLLLGTVPFVASSSRLGTPQGLITTLLSRCQLLSLFLSNVTLGCVTMVTTEKQGEEKTPSYRLFCPSSQATSGVLSFFLFYRRGN